MDKATAPDWGTIGMTVEEAADTLRVERRSVLDAIADRGLPAVRIGRGWRIDPDALKAWIARGQRVERADDGYEVSCRFYCDKDRDTLRVELDGHVLSELVGGALDVELDGKLRQQVVFKDADGTTVHALLGIDEPGDFSPDETPLAELGKWVSEKGYRVEPGMEALVGCYLAAKLEEAAEAGLAEYERRQAEAKAGQ